MSLVIAHLVRSKFDALYDGFAGFVSAGVGAKVGNFVGVPVVGAGVAGAGVAGAGGEGVGLYEYEP